MLDTIKLVQRIHDLTDAEMASKLGVSRGYWNEVKKGHYRLSEPLIDSAKQAFPEIEALFLSNNITIGKAR
jgi:DNA-binding XRE family transcriptional regulator